MFIIYVYDAKLDSGCFKSWNNLGLFSFFVSFDGIFVPFNDFIS